MRYNIRAGESYINQSKTPTQKAIIKFTSETEDQNQKKGGSGLLKEDLMFSQLLKIAESLLDCADLLEWFPRATTFSSWGLPSTLSLYHNNQNFALFSSQSGFCWKCWSQKEASANNKPLKSQKLDGELKSTPIQVYTKIQKIQTKMDNFSFRAIDLFNLQSCCCLHLP